jgi:hypothetical protein
MKTFTFFILLVLIATGAFAGMLYAHVVPVTDLADRVPGAGRALASLGLYPSSSTPSTTELSPDDQLGQPITVAPNQRTVHFARHHARVRPTGLARYDNPSLNTADAPTITARLARIYDTMPSSLVAKILTHQSDNEAARELSAMNESKAGQVIAKMETMRAARVTAVMAGQTEPSAKRSQSQDQSGIAID